MSSHVSKHGSSSVVSKGIFYTEHRNRKSTPFLGMVVPGMFRAMSCMLFVKCNDNSLNSVQDHYTAPEGMISSGLPMSGSDLNLDMAQGNKPPMYKIEGGVMKPMTNEDMSAWQLLLDVLDEEKAGNFKNLELARRSPKFNALPFSRSKKWYYIPTESINLKGINLDNPKENSFVDKVSAPLQLVRDNYEYHIPHHQHQLDPSKIPKYMRDVVDEKEIAPFLKNMAEKSELDRARAEARLVGMEIV